LISTIDFNEQHSVDINLQYQNYFKPSDGTGDTFFFNAEYGARILNGQVLLIAGLGYQSTSLKDFNQNKLTLYPGIAIETGNRYAIVLSLSSDLTGRNMSKTNGFYLTLTTILD